MVLRHDSRDPSLQAYAHDDVYDVALYFSPRDPPSRAQRYALSLILRYLGDPSYRAPSARGDRFDPDTLQPLDPNLSQQAFLRLPYFPRALWSTDSLATELARLPKVEGVTVTYDPGPPIHAYPTTAQIIADPKFIDPHTGQPREEPPGWKAERDQERAEKARPRPPPPPKPGQRRTSAGRTTSGSAGSS